jgi:hypothetical protein
MNKKIFFTVSAVVSIVSMAIIIWRTISTINIYKYVELHPEVAGGGAAIAESLSTTIFLVRYLPIIAIAANLIMLAIFNSITKRVNPSA